MLQLIWGLCLLVLLAGAGLSHPEEADPLSY